MNRSYRSKWSAALGAWVAVSEKSRSRGKRTTAIVALALGAGQIMLAPPAWAACTDSLTGASATAGSTCATGITAYTGSATQAANTGVLQSTGAGSVLDAAGAADEAVWPLPLPDHLRKTLDSNIADLRNIGTGSYGGALSAAIFLREFVDDRPWVHLDIAGPSNSSSAHDEVAKGGTGFGVRTLARLLGSWTKLDA